MTEKETKRLMEGRKAIARIVENNFDAELETSIFKAIFDAATDDEGKGDTRRAICALAGATATLLHVFAKKSNPPKPTHVLFTELYAPLLSCRCELEDMPDPDDDDDDDEQADA